MTELIYAGSITSTKGRSPWNSGVVTGYSVQLHPSSGTITRTFAVSKYPTAEDALTAAEEAMRTLSDLHNLTVVRPDMTKFWDEELRTPWEHQGASVSEYIAGLYDGDGCISLNAEGKIRVALSQSEERGKPVVVGYIQHRYDANYHTTPSVAGNARNAHCVILYGKYAIEILREIESFGILKAGQATAAIKFIVKDINYEECYEEVSNAKTTSRYSSVPIIISRLTPAYIAGFFDAEGCIMVNKTSSICAQISQRQSPALLLAIIDLYPGGSLDAKRDKALWCGANALTLLSAIAPYSIHKREQVLCALKLGSFTKINPAKRTLVDREHMKALADHIKAQKYI